ncbi:MAG TPA: metallophosphoesterase family protein [Caldisericia bacterium]|nr:metallophosphoesterase family protein [Caldisericia bacterium]HPF49064.1 metallophosphoesterase family protein [Caldisericia bacterium]HPI83072.1 metallophosphoesterase family protein [Caldisericia bacterium]HPQ92299.1 metallophosphoesterase family protein [Caldisericia bacterium]HRV74603.1 metallophosphoesterase family protein [Caldisericia bacterium]
MKYGIFSDIHANLDAFERVLAFLEKEGVEEYVCCGDIVGYNANPDECVSLVVDMGMQAIMGNHDKALIDPIEERYFNQYGLTAIRWQRARVKPSNQTFLKNLPSRLTVSKPNSHSLFQVAHGSLDPSAPFEYIASPMEALRMSELMTSNLCFIGHSHIAGVFIIDNEGDVDYLRASHGLKVKMEPGLKYVVNVGSVGQPRDRNPQSSFCIYDSDTRTIEIHRIDYNVALTIERITEAGLPLFLADRLRIGW